MNRLRYGASNFLLELLFIALALVVLFPFYLLASVAFKSPVDVAKSTVSPPTSLYTDNLTLAWSEADLGRAFVNSTLITVFSVLLLIAVGSAAAFALVRGTRRLHKIALVSITLGITIPLQLGMVPLYQLMRDFGLLQSQLSVILFNVGSLLPITVFLYAGFLVVQPAEYEEAARVDGATPLQTFTRVVFPLLRPVTGTVIVLNAVHVWNDFLTPLLYLSGTPNRTLPVAIFAFKGEFATQWGVIFAGILIAVIPMVVIFFVLQKYVIKGFANGLKG